VSAFYAIATKPQGSGRYPQASCTAIAVNAPCRSLVEEGSRFAFDISILAIIRNYETLCREYQSLDRHRLLHAVFSEHDLLEQGG